MHRKKKKKNQKEQKKSFKIIYDMIRTSYYFTFETSKTNAFFINS